jgi:hypothetical protein
VVSPCALALKNLCLEPVLGVDPLAEHHQLRLEEDHGIDGPAALGIQLAGPVAHEAQVERCFEMAGDVVVRNERRTGYGVGLMETTRLRRAEPGARRDAGRFGPSGLIPTADARMP